MAGEYASIVKEKSVLRSILNTSQKIAGDVYSDKETTDILEAIEKRVFDLTQVNIADSMMHIRDVLDGRIEAYMENIDDPGKLEREKVYTGYGPLDELL